MELRDKKKSDREESRRASSVRARGDREEERNQAGGHADRRKKIVKVRGEGEEGGVTRRTRTGR